MSDLASARPGDFVTVRLEFGGLSGNGAAVSVASLHDGFFSVAASAVVAIEARALKVGDEVEFLTRGPVAHVRRGRLVGVDDGAGWVRIDDPLCSVLHHITVPLDILTRI